MDYWEAITTRWRRLPDFVYKHRNDARFLQAYYEIRSQSRGEYVTRLQVELMVEKLCKSSGASRPLPKPKVKKPTLIQYYAIVHLIEGNKIIGPYTSLNAAENARKIVVSTALRKGKAKAIEVAWFNQRRKYSDE